MRRRAGDSFFDLNPGIISSLNGTAHRAKANSSGGCALPTERRPRFLPDGSASGDRVWGARQGPAIIARHVPELNILSQLSCCSDPVVAILLSRSLVTALL